MLTPAMEWLNYHHLLYFWVVAKRGSIVRASEELRLAHPTISGQIHRLEDVPRREAVRAPGAEPGAHGIGPRRVSLR